MTGEMTADQQFMLLLILVGIVAAWFYVRSDRWRK